MKRYVVKFLSFSLALFVFFSSSSAVFAAENSTINETASTQHKFECGNVVVCDSLILLDEGYYCILEGSDECEEISTYSYTEKVKTGTFYSTVSDRNGNFIADLTTVVTGVYSYADNYATINSISATYSNAVISGLSYTTAYNGNTATLYITLNGAIIGSMTYKLYTNGSLQIV